MSSAAMAQTVVIGATSRLCWVTHLPVGWVFTPARGRGTCLTAASTPTFVGAFPHWTGGLAGTWSDEVAKDQNNCANVIPPRLPGSAPDGIVALRVTFRRCNTGSGEIALNAR